MSSDELLNAMKELTGSMKEFLKVQEKDYTDKKAENEAVIAAEKKSTELAAKQKIRQVEEDKRRKEQDKLLDRQKRNSSSSSMSKNPFTAKEKNITLTSKEKKEYYNKNPLTTQELQAGKKEGLTLQQQIKRKKDGASTRQKRMLARDRRILSAKKEKEAQNPKQQEEIENQKLQSQLNRMNHPNYNVKPKGRVGNKVAEVANKFKNNKRLKPNWKDNLKDSLDYSESLSPKNIKAQNKRMKDFLQRKP